MRTQIVSLILPKFQALKDHLSKINSPLVLCHMDLLPPNIVYNEKEGRIISFMQS